MLFTTRVKLHRWQPVSKILSAYRYDLRYYQLSTEISKIKTDTLMRVCFFYVLLFSFRQLSQQLQLTAVIKADAADGDLPFYSLQITAQQADSFRFELVKAEQFFKLLILAGQSQVIVETAALEQHTVVIENLDRSLQSGNSFGRDII